MEVTVSAVRTGSRNTSLIVLIAACSGNATHPIANRSHTRGEVISACRGRLEQAKQQYEVRSSPSGEVQIATFEATQWGHHGEPPSVTFTVTGEGNSMSFVWFQGRHNPTRAWVSDDQARFLGSSRGGAAVLMWGSEDVRWRPFAVAFQPAADACLTAFADVRSPRRQ